MTPFQREHGPALRDLLVGRARLGEVITYGDAASVLGIHHRSMATLLGEIGRQCVARGEPVLTAMVVNAATGECGSGMQTEFGVQDAAAERENCKQWWKRCVEEPTSNLARRAVRFAAVEARPDQAAFRSRVYRAYGGRCALSGCRIASLLDAAHKPGRDWRAGHNSAEDGILLRADLHRLLDASLMRLEDSGRVSISGEATNEYGAFDGVCWVPPPLDVVNGR